MLNNITTASGFERVNAVTLIGFISVDMILFFGASNHLKSQIKFEEPFVIIFGKILKKFS